MFKNTTTRKFHATPSMAFDPDRDQFNEFDGSRLDDMGGIVLICETHREADEYFSTKHQSIQSHFNDRITQATSQGASQSAIDSLNQTRDNLLAGLVEQRASIEDDLVSSTPPSGASGTDGEGGPSGGESGGEDGGEGGQSDSDSEHFPQDSSDISPDTDMPDYFGGGDD